MLCCTEIRRNRTHRTNSLRHAAADATTPMDATRRSRRPGADDSADDPADDPQPEFTEVEAADHAWRQTPHLVQLSSSRRSALKSMSP